MAQQGLIRQLREHLDNGEVIIVAGTGVSIETSGGVPCASWKGLIDHGIQYALEHDHIDEATAGSLRLDLNGKDPAQWPEVAQQVSDALSAPGPDFRAWLQSSVGGLNRANPALVEVIRALGAPLATTNYDDLLRAARNESAVPWTDVAAVADWLRDRRQGILHLHGHFEVPDSIVFGDRSYQRLLSDERAQFVERALTQTRTLLFIGCGDGLFDPNFGALLDWISTHFGESPYRHFCLCRMVDKTPLQSRLPSGRSVAYITYGDDFNKLAGFIRAELLSPSRKRRAETAATLPARSYCIGREREVEEVIAALLADSPMRLPVVGPPGSGKSTVAAQALRDPRVAGRYGARRWFVRCEAAENRSALVALLAAALELTRELGVEVAVLEELSAQPGALVLDNLETALNGDRDAVEDLLGQLALRESLALVATIRGATRPMSVAWASTVEMTPLDDEPAREAFIAHSGKPAFAEDLYFHRLVGALEGLPLAIMLMGRYAQSYRSLALVWQAWQQKRTAMLEGFARSIEVSITPLSGSAKRLLSVVAMLPNGVAHTDVSAVFADGERNAHELRDAALLFDEAGRVRMLSPIREYLVSERRVVRHSDALRAIRHYVTLAAAEAEKIGDLAGADAVRRLAPEATTIEAVLTMDRTPLDDRLIDAAVGWTTLIRFTGLGSSEAVAHVAGRAKDAGMTEAAARCIHGLGDIAVAQTDFVAARAYYTEARQLFASAGSEDGIAACEQGFGAVAIRQGNFDLARKQFEKALKVFDRRGDKRRAAVCIQSLGDAFHRLRNYAEAESRYDAAYRLFVEIGSPSGQASCLKSLGNIALVSDHARAADLFTAAQKLYYAVGNVRGEAKCIKGFGHIALERRDYAAARDAYETAMPLFTQVGSILGQAICIQGLAETELRERHYALAWSQFEEALALYRKLQDRGDSIAKCEAKLAEIEQLASAP